MSLFKRIYYGLPERVFADLKITRKPLLLVFVVFALTFVFSFGLAVYVFVAHTVAPLKGMVVGLAVLQKLTYSINHQPIPDSLESTIHNATSAEQSFAGWFIIFAFFETALLLVAFVWAGVLGRKATSKRNDVKKRSDSDTHQS
jgi:hypothetical protein